jgi:DNA polymerase III sliding clamp (beta) subunit (PCNA family)
MKPILQISKYDLLAADFASRDDSRPILTTVLVRKKNGNIELVATDSYVAVIHQVKELNDASIDFEQFLIPAATLRFAKKMIGTKSNARQIHTVDIYTDHITLPTLGISIDYKAPDGSYPDLDKLIASMDKRTDFKDCILNAAYIIKVAKAFNTDWVSNGTLKIKVNAHLAPVEFSNDRTYALIMPLKN